MENVDTSEMNISARREILYTLADVKNICNYYILKTAGALDRVLRASNTAAQQKARQLMDTLFEENDSSRQKPFL